MFNACSSGNKRLVKYLVEHGADINIPNNTDRTPLFNACFIKNEELVKYLVEIGADINKQNDNGVTPLFMSVM